MDFRWCQTVSATPDGWRACDGGWSPRCWGNFGRAKGTLLLTGSGSGGAGVCSTGRALCGFKKWSGKTSPVNCVTALCVVGEVFHFDYFHLVNTDEGRALFAEEEGYEYLMVMVEDISGFMSLETAHFCSSAMSARKLS